MFKFFVTLFLLLNISVAQAEIISTHRYNPYSNYRRVNPQRHGVSNFNPYQYRNMRNRIYYRPQNQRKRSIMRNLANYFIGEPTGFTPSINEQNYYNSFGEFAYPTGLNTGRYEEFSNGIFGGGWDYSESGLGNNSSIKILD